MNGIVHPCTHPEGRPAPETEAEMMVEVFRYTERVVNMARPRKVLVMAIDGVAPRAKMNQQRSRRFRAAQEAEDKEKERLEGIKIYEAMGQTVSAETKNKKAWDSNAITPGKSTVIRDLQRLTFRYTFHGPLVGELKVLGVPETHQRSWMERRKSANLSTLTTSSKSSFQMPRFPEKESTRLSTGSGGSVLTPAGTPTPATPSTVSMQT